MAVGGAGADPVTAVPALFQGFCDDAALFPPGNAPLTEAVPAHLEYERRWFADLVGPFVVPVSRIEELGAVLAEDGPALPVSLTAPAGAATLPAALANIGVLGRARLAAIEVAVPTEAPTGEFFGRLADLVLAPDVDVYVEVPRDERREAVLDGIAAAGLRAKFRTGGVRADLYPDEAELTDSIRHAVERGIAFKATAGLHHAIRNTDPATGFEQHGALNLLLAAAAATAGRPAGELVELLGLRDPGEITRRVRDADPAVRRTFVSYGTCSISEPLEDLVGLGLITKPTRVEEVTA